MSNVKKYRSRVHMVLLYPENTEHLEVLENIKKNYDCAYILHDMDITEDGEVKKAHFHVIIRTQNATWNTALCSAIGLNETNLVQHIRNIDNALLYLVHFNEPEKYQYNLADVKGNLKDKLVSAMNNQNKSEGEKVSELIDYIENYKGYLSLTAFSKFCASNGYWSEFRRSGSIFIKIIEEKNGMKK